MRRSMSPMAALGRSSNIHKNGRCNKLTQGRQSSDTGGPVIHMWKTNESLEGSCCL